MMEDSQSKKATVRQDLARSADLGGQVTWPSIALWALFCVVY
jgi:hypothetical protein